MKEISVRFHSCFPKTVELFLVNIIRAHFDIEYKEYNYDFYFASEAIYWSEKNFKEFLESSNNSTKIMFCGEAVYPDLNIFDYAIVLQRTLMQSEDRILYLPYIYLASSLERGLLPELDIMKDNIDPERVLKSKVAFCNFIYSNGRADHHRDDIFYGLTSYKKIDSMGKHLNNTGNENNRNDKNWQELSIEMKKPYKFSIAAENAYFRGYTSEKITTSMLAYSIPIYWGNPLVGAEYNKQAFIDAQDFENIKELVDYVRDVDTDDQKWCDIMGHKWRTSYQIQDYNAKVEEFNRRIFRMLDDNSVRFRPTGTFCEHIYIPFLRGKNEKTGLKMILRKLRMQ